MGGIFDCELTVALLLQVKGMALHRRRQLIPLLERLDIDGSNDLNSMIEKGSHQVTADKATRTAHHCPLHFSTHKQTYLGIEPEQAWLTLPRTHLIGDRVSGESVSIPTELISKISLEKTNLLSRMFHRWVGMPVSLLSEMKSRSSVYGYLGWKTSPDFR